MNLFIANRLEGLLETVETLVALALVVGELGGFHYAGWRREIVASAVEESEKVPGVGVHGLKDLSTFWESVMEH